MSKYTADNLTEDDLRPLYASKAVSLQDLVFAVCYGHTTSGHRIRARIAEFLNARAAEEKP